MMRWAWQSGLLRGDHGGDGPRGLVVKLGGSLLARPEWLPLVRSLFQPGEQGDPGESAMRIDVAGSAALIVVGGGSRVDAIRRLDHAIGLDPSVSHRLAIDAMGITARLVAESTGWPLVLDAGGSSGPRVLDTPAWLDAHARFDRLPVGWHVTSDSIAAVVAAEMSSDLLLVKSTPPPTLSMHAAHPIDDTAALGWIDAWFPTAAAHVGRIAWAAPA